MRFLSREAGLRCLLKLLLSVLSQQFMDLQAARVWIVAQERFVDQPRQLLQRGSRNLLGCFPRKTASENREAHEYLLLSLIQQRPGVIKNGADAAMALWRITHFGCKDIQAFLEFPDNFIHIQDVQPGSCQLDCQRHPLHDLTDICDSAPVRRGEGSNPGRTLRALCTNKVMAS